MEMSGSEAIRQGIEAGLGLSLKRLVILDVRELPILHRCDVMHCAGKRLSAMAQSFREFVLTESGQILRLPTVEQCWTPAAEPQGLKRPFTTKAHEGKSVFPTRGFAFLYGLSCLVNAADQSVHAKPHQQLHRNNILLLRVPLWFDGLYRPVREALINSTKLVIAP